MLSRAKEEWPGPGQHALVAGVRQHPTATVLAIALAISGAFALPSCGSRTRSEPVPVSAPAPPDTLPPLDHLPLDPPLQITATFGEYRRGHFHAGVDFATHQSIGWPVYAPVSGYVERVRTSGTGYGRSLMLRTSDGRTILLAHLDAFDEPIASWVAAVQDSSGEYEQDLAPAPGQMVVSAGQRIAWSGNSGVGPPHLHMEVRFGNLAYNPLRFGLAVPDSAAPVLGRVTLEPLDDTSYVAGSAAPRSFGGPADTVVVEGRVRAWLEAADGVSDPWPRAAPYAAELEWRGATVQCRFDRIAWDEDMSAVEWVYDGTGRAAPGRGLGLWIAPEFRPSVMSAAAGAGAESRAAESGVIAVGPGDPARPLTFRARDAAGNVSEHRLVLRPPRDGERGPRSFQGRRRRRASSRFDFVPVTGRFVRIGYSGAPPGSGVVELGLSGDSLALRPASFDGARWWAVVRVPTGAAAMIARGRRLGAPWEDRRAVSLVALTPGTGAVVTAADSVSSWSWSLPPQGVFAPAFVVCDSLAPGRGAPGLAAMSPIFGVGPGRLPLRRPARIAVALHRRDSSRTGLFFERGGVWSPAGPAPDEIAAESSPGSGLTGAARGLGRFAAFEDTAAPRIGLARAIRIRTGAPNRWAFQCRVFDRGGGLDLARTGFVIDGRKVPSEWDGERGVLTWRPLRPPAIGEHRYEVVVVDRAGLESRKSGSLVVR